MTRYSILYTLIKQAYDPSKGGPESFKSPVMGTLGSQSGIPGIPGVRKGEISTPAKPVATITPAMKVPVQSREGAQLQPKTAAVRSLMRYFPMKTPNVGIRANRNRQMQNSFMQ